MSSAAIERYKQENQEQKRNRRRIILQSAYHLFCQKGIDNTTFQDVADYSEFGVATIYRYFPNKTEMALQAALYNWEIGFLDLIHESRRNHVGGDQICFVFYGYVHLFFSKPDVYRFMEDFDNYISRLKGLPESLALYEELLKKFNAYIAEMISLAFRDDFLQNKDNMDQYYSMMFNAFVAFAQKLLNRRSRTHDIQDRLWRDTDQMALLVETLIGNIMTVKGIMHYDKIKASCQFQ